MTDRTVNQQRAVEFASDVGAVFDVQTVDLLARFTGLSGDEGVAQHFLGVSDDFVDREGQTHAALGVSAQFLELALTTATGVDLRLHDIEGARQLLGSVSGFFNRGDRHASSDRGAITLEDLFGLIFVDVHV